MKSSPGPSSSTEFGNCRGIRKTTVVQCRPTHSRHAIQPPVGTQSQPGASKSRCDVKSARGPSRAVQPIFVPYVIWHTDRRHEAPICSRCLAFRCVRGRNMHQAEYLAQTVANLMMQRAELQRLRDAVEAAEGSSLRGAGEKVQVRRRRARPTVMRDPSFAEITASGR
jgi:hypothetical protein